MSLLMALDCLKKENNEQKSLESQLKAWTEAQELSMTGKQNHVSSRGRAKTTENQMPGLFWWIAALYQLDDQIYVVCT